MKKIVKVEVLEDYKIDLTFADETKGVADLARLAGKGVFSLWGDYSEFRKVQIGSSGELIWGDQIDLCPDALYLEITGRHPADVFPAFLALSLHSAPARYSGNQTKGDDW